MPCRRNDHLNKTWNCLSPFCVYTYKNKYFHFVARNSAISHSNNRIQQIILAVDDQFTAIHGEWRTARRWESSARPCHSSRLRWLQCRRTAVHPRHHPFAVRSLAIRLRQPKGRPRTDVAGCGRPTIDWPRRTRRQTSGLAGDQHTRSYGRMDGAASSKHHADVYTHTHIYIYIYI